MANFDKIRAEIETAFKGNITTEQAEALGRLKSVVDEAEKEDKDFIQKHEELRVKYIEAVKNQAFVGEPKVKDEEPKDLAYYLQKEANKSKK